MHKARRLKNSISELEQLKKLLLEPELEQLKKLEAKLKTLDFQSQDQETIIERVTPLFDEILLERLRNKDAQTIKILSDHFTKIISQSSSNNLTELSESLQSVIAPAIAKEIAENQNVMVDALYPIMGGMISKYVSTAIKEMIESINEKIEDGLSFDKYKRKIKSKITGVSETELLLEESSDATIQSLFVIQKETGLLVAEAHLNDKEIDDPHMVASMASAIKDFVNDWIQNAKESSEVQLLSYGNATLYIESAGSVYLIAFLDAEPDHEQRSKINEFFAKLVKNYSSYFQHFDGDDSSEEVKSISQMMHTFLYMQTKTEKENDTESKKSLIKKSPVKYILIFPGVILFGYFFYLLNQYYFAYRLENHILGKTQQSVHIKRIDNKMHISGNISSMHDFYAIQKIILKETGETFINDMHMPLEEIDKKFTNQNNLISQVEGNLSVHMSQLLDKVATLEQRMNTLAAKYDNAQTEIDRLKNTTSQIKKITQMKQHIIKKLAKRFAKNDTFCSEDASLDFKNKRLFNIEDVIPNIEVIKPLADAFEIYVEQLMNDKQIAPYIKSIIIEGYTDSSGSYAYNKNLSLQRALKIKEYLLQLNVSKKYHLVKILQAKGLANENSIIVNGVEDKEASRRIKIKFEINTQKMINSIKKTNT